MAYPQPEAPTRIVKGTQFDMLSLNEIPTISLIKWEIN